MTEDLHEKLKSHEFWNKQNFTKCPICGEKLDGTFDLKAEIAKGTPMNELEKIRLKSIEEKSR